MDGPRSGTVSVGLGHEVWSPVYKNVKKFINSKYLNKWSMDPEKPR